jgi:hypothetical protein
MEIGRIIDAIDVLNRLSANDSLPTKVAYRLYSLLKKLNTSVEFFETKKNDLFKKYGKDDGVNITIIPENQEEFLNKLNEIRGLDCLEEFEKIDISIETNLGVSPADIFLLEPFINFVE